MSIEVCVMKDVNYPKLEGAFETLREANRVRSDVEKCLRQNGFNVFFMTGKLDSKMSDLFPGLGVNILEQVGRLLSDNPWQKKICWQTIKGVSCIDQQTYEAVKKCIVAHREIMKLLSDCTRNYIQMAPQPSEEELASLQSDVTLLDSDEGTYYLCRTGTIETRKDGATIVLFASLFYSPVVEFPRGYGERSYASLLDLKTAQSVRARMKGMMETALEASKNREEKRKVSKAADTE